MARVGAPERLGAAFDTRPDQETRRHSRNPGSPDPARQTRAPPESSKLSLDRFRLAGAHRTRQK